MQKKLSVILIFLFLIMPVNVMADINMEDNTLENVQVITKVNNFSKEYLKQKVVVDNIKGIKFPSNISVTLEDGSIKSIPITWDNNLINKSVKKSGVYTFKPIIKDSYKINDTLIPKIKVEVIKIKTSIKQVHKDYNIKARLNIKDNITVYNGNNRYLELQMLVNGKWKTYKKYKLNNKASYNFTITYPKNWWYVTNSTWRLLIRENNKYTGFTTSNIKIKTKKYYQNLKKYVQIKNKITLKGNAGYNLKLGYMGLKVKKVNAYFKIGDKNWPRYTNETVKKVKSFQKKNKLKVTGVVDKKTWMKMGFSEKSWTTLGAYVSPIKINPASTKKDHINAMIKRAKEYLGTSYVVGASGKVKEGVDCSGLVMQALYAAGVDPYPITPIRHSKPGYEYESRNLWKYKGFKTVSYSKRQKGDLIFYKGRSGSVNHVAIYLGNNKVIESYPNKVMISDILGRDHDKIMGVKRVFN